MFNALPDLMAGDSPRSPQGQQETGPAGCSLAQPQVCSVPQEEWVTADPGIHIQCQWLQCPILAKNFSQARTSINVHGIFFILTLKLGWLKCQSKKPPKTILKIPISLKAMHTHRVTGLTHEICRGKNQDHSPFHCYASTKDGGEYTNPNFDTQLL